MNKLLAFVAILSIAFAQNTLVTFKDKDCEHLAMESHQDLFGEDSEYLENVKVLIIHKDLNQIAKLFMDNDYS